MNKQLTIFDKIEYHVLVNGRAMKPKGGEPYKFSTYLDALNAVDICYGLSLIGKGIEIKEADLIKEAPDEPIHQV